LTCRLTGVKTARLKARVFTLFTDNKRIGLDSLVGLTKGDADSLNFPTNVAGYWEKSALLDQPGNTIIFGFEVESIFDPLPQIIPDDMLIVTDQYGIDHAYTVTQNRDL